MRFVELLDKIDSTAPRCCQTCRHMATHKLCDKDLGKGRCLGEMAFDPKVKAADLVFPYHNWEPGNYLRDLQAAEMSGERSIVIGGQGEAEVNASDTPEQTSKHLHYVAECCGYLCGNLRRNCNSFYGDTQLTIHTNEGEYLIGWDNANKLKGVWNITGKPNPDTKLYPCEWPRF